MKPAKVEKKRVTVKSGCYFRQNNGTHPECFHSHKHLNSVTTRTNFDIFVAHKVQLGVLLESPPSHLILLFYIVNIVQDSRTPFSIVFFV
ncbi:hypothetical protein P3L10_001377 [Capsicum annuum]